MSKQPFLVAYDYGQGAIWFFVRAQDQAEIASRFPELSVVRDVPDWMTEDELRRLAATMTFELDQGDGLLADILAHRDARGERPTAAT